MDNSRQVHQPPGETSNSGQLIWAIPTSATKTLSGKTIAS